MKNDKIKFSIIMPFYNAEQYIINALQSLLNQTYNNWELIAVNDGSTDESKSIVLSFNDKRINIIDKKNGGYATAINEGLLHVTGKYVLMLGSDDLLNTMLFEKINIKLCNIDPDIIEFRCIKRQQNKDSKTNIDKYSNFKKELYFTGDLKSYYESHPYEASFLAMRDTGKMYKTSLLKNSYYYGFSGFDADGIFSLTFSHYCTRFLTVPFDGYYWIVRSDSVSSRTCSVEILIDRLDNWICFLKFLLIIETSQLTPIDVSLIGIGFEEIIPSLSKGGFKLFFSHYSTIRKYCYLFKIVCKKHKIKKYGKKIWFALHFPPASYFLKWLNH